ncbi:ABC transporter permease [Clostridium saccharoperbutylacetonicum]|uniref:ABC transporter permease n=1 Tax=Clostridium saccharoperbutylacetonicum TaxID=36745 RepID=UPI0039ED0CE5
MFFEIVKKEMKQLLIAKKTLIFLFIFPIVLITALSVGLKNMMTSGDIFGTGNEYSKVYYTQNKDSKYNQGILDFKKGVEGAVNIKFEETSSLDKAKEEVDKYDALAYIEVTDVGYKFYSSKNGEKMKGKIFESIFKSILNEYASYETIAKYNQKAFTNLVKNKYDDYVVKKDISGVRDITSSEYYTFTELALIILYIASIIGDSVYKEKWLKTINRIKLSKANESTFILAKIFTGIFISILQILIVYAYSSVVLEVNWGENALKFIAMFLAFGIFASVLGAVLGIIAENFNTVSGILNFVTIVICFLGGCYVPLHMIIGISPINKLVYFSPIYWINTAVSSMLCGIESNAFMIALGLPIALSAICFLVFIGILKNKGGLAND